MSRHRSTRLSEGTITGIAEATAERVRLSGEILIAMAEAMARTEKIEQRFRNAVIHKLSRIEALLGLVHVSQLARDQSPPSYFADKLVEDSQAAEDYISRQSYEAGLTAVTYIYGEEQKTAAKSKRRRKWADCPLYEI